MAAENDDRELLAAVRAAVQDIDPMPAGLVDRVTFALAVDEVVREAETAVEVAVVAEVALEGARADTRPGRLRSLEITARGVTVMLTISPEAETVGRFRVDGWLASSSSRRRTWEVRLRFDDGDDDSTTAVDADGRFVLTGVPAGTAQLVLVCAGANAVTVVTPSFPI